MYESFIDIEHLKNRVLEDKLDTGVGVSTRNRYPIRFVLFDNFRDCYDFVEYLQLDRGVQVESVDKWLDADYPDCIITSVELAVQICDYIDKISPEDSVIAPFSELARFYNNDTIKSFDALITTIKAKEAKLEAAKKQQRIYIPIVGLEGKMDTFQNDSQITIWRLPSEEKDLTYRLILTDNKDFGVKGLECNYTIVNNIREWLDIWKDTGKQSTPNIICKSRAIYANAVYAQPDNAFSYVTCNNAYQFLVQGLQLYFGGLQPLTSDGDNWERLAKCIDLSEGFNFAKFVQDYFGVNEVEDYKDFIRIWFSYPQGFDRWLLARYYMNKNGDSGYLCKMLRETTKYGTAELIENMAYQLPSSSEDIQERNYCLKYAVKQKVQLPENVESMVANVLEALPAKLGFASALTYFTGISRKEKEIALTWLGQGKILASDVKPFFPDLYYYVEEGIGVAKSVPEWLDNYFTDYKRAKISNKYRPEVESIIKEKNANEAEFYTWYHKFSTTYTELKDRGDIEVFYWIDGLGVDWVPLIKEIVAEKKDQQIFLNEIKIARAKLPTKTEVNKNDLQRLLPKGATLEKSGDLDSLAHRTNNISPYTLIKEIELVRKTIENILQMYIGKKIAIISDHGISYLPQLCNGLNMAGVESDHHGRIAVREKPSDIADDSYVRLDDKVTLCALKHESLCGKVPLNQGAHGGCTPEEALVPIFIISSAPAACNWNAIPLTYTLSGANPRFQVEIKNLPGMDKPYIIYNGTKYPMHHVNGDVYESTDIALDKSVREVILNVGCVDRVFKVDVNTGVKEEDLFDF